MTHPSPSADRRECDPAAAAQLLPLVYEELRKLAVRRMAQESGEQTLQPTALVHEAYLRVAGGDQNMQWESRAHFFAATAEAMRRILVDRARRKQRHKHGGHRQRQVFDEKELAADVPAEEILAVHESLQRFEQQNLLAANLVKLRYFGGFTIPEVASQLGISPRKANQLWAYARAWLLTDINGCNSQ